MRIDGVGLWEFPDQITGYREVREHDLDQPLTTDTRYDAVVCSEAIHLLTNPGVAIESFYNALKPGGRVIITTPNIWNQRSRWQFWWRGFHSGFRPMVGRQSGRDYVTYFPWNFPQLHLLLDHYGFKDIQLHEVEEPKPKRWVEHVLALPSRLYCWRQAERSSTELEYQYWRHAGSAQSQHGRWLVVSGRRPDIGGLSVID